MQAPGVRSRSRAALRGAAWAAVVVALVGQGSAGREVRAGAAFAGQAGMRVALQPESGDLVPAGGVPGGVTGFAEVAGEPVIRRRPDGGYYADLGDRCVHYVVVQRAADGRLVQGCTDDGAKAQALAASIEPVAAPVTDARGWEVR